MARPPSRRHRKILAIARAEVDPAQAEKFTPVTKGPILNGLGVLTLGCVALPYLLVMKLLKALGYGRSTGL
jgi:hypothetical protein